MTFAIKLLCLTILLSLCGVSVAQEGELYTPGHGALQVFDEQGWQATPQWVQVWIGIMAMSFLAGILFLKNHIPARWLIGGFVAGILFSKIAFSVFDLLPLSGLVALVHIVFWSPGLYKLVKEHAFLGPLSAYSVWAGWITFVVLFSFFFDMRDAAIYLNHMLLS